MNSVNFCGEMRIFDIITIIIIIIIIYLSESISKYMNGTANISIKQQ